MPDLTSAEVAASLRDTLLPILLIVVFAVLAMRLATLFVHGIVKTLLDREATEGTAQELSAVELKKRMDTLDGFAARTIQFVIVTIAGLMILAKLGLDIGPAVAGLGIVGSRSGSGHRPWCAITSRAR
jgi:small-conductance mechanosensitive channel